MAVDDVTEIGSVDLLIPEGWEVNESSVYHEIIISSDASLLLDGVDLTFKRGTITSIFGPSGCGKTTLLKLMAGNLKPDSGRIKINGDCLSTVSSRGVYNIRKQIGFLFQKIFSKCQL